LSNLKEVNRLAGGLFLDSELQRLVDQAWYILPIDGKPGGMDALKGQLLGTLKEGAETFGSLSF